MTDTHSRRKVWHDDPELEELLARATKHERLAYLLMCDAGCRLREALAFDPSSISLPLLRIWATKTNTWRSVPIPDRLSEAIASVPGEVPLQHLTPRQVQRRLLHLCAAAGTELSSPHWLRHAYATRLHLEGIPLHIISALMGHASRAMTLRYIHSEENDYEAAKRALDRRANTHRKRRRRRRPRSRH